MKKIIGIIIVAIIVVGGVFSFTQINDKTIKYEFKSTDETAVLKVYELTDENLSFEYNSGFDFSKNTIDRNVEGTATTNAEKLYEYEENVSGHQYKIAFEFNADKDKVTVYEYDNGDDLSKINLWNNTPTN